MQDYVKAHGWMKDRPEGRMIALVGDAEMDEGNIFEALLEGWKHGRVTVHPEMGPLHRRFITKLEQASGSDFDQVYLNIVAADLGSTESYLDNKGRAAKSADVRNAANEELPLVREQLSTAQRLDRQLQTNANTNAKGKDKDKDKGKSVSSKE